MKIHARQIPEEGLHLEGEENSDILDLPPGEHVRRLGPWRYALDLGISDGGIWVTGKVELDVELECVRCLELFEYPLRATGIALQVDLEGLETIDLTPHLREDILLALPAHPHCDWSGEKICPVRLQAEAKAGRLDPGEDALGAGPASAWQTLDQLKTPSK